MSDVRLTLDREPRVVEAGRTAGELLAAAGVAGVAVRVNGEALRDLAWVPADGDVLESVPLASPEGRAILRHSAAHVLAQAVQDLFPGTALGIGPPVTDGFYYDFAPPRPFTPDDLAAIERRMGEIVAQRQRFSRRVVSAEQAREELAGEPFKLELLDLAHGPGSGAAADAAAGDAALEDAADGASAEVGGTEITLYDNLVVPADGEPTRVWSDLCRGPHLPSTRDIPAFRLLRSAAAYWRGSERNPQLQRIYGTAWESRDALKAYLHRLAEAERRDHRRLGAELDLFSFPEELGSGLPVFHPKGGAVRRVMEDYSRARHEQAGYQFVATPHVSKEGLFHTSGHLPYYADGMFPPLELDGARYYLKAMNCPMHNLVYAARGRSYRELPLRLFEFGTVYRYEKSGVVHGLTRVRGLTMDDAHIYCSVEQMPAELTALLTFVLDLLRDFGLDDFYLELSTRDDSDKFVGEPQEWEQATEALRVAAATSGLALVPDPGGAAYYGPKISVQARDAIGRTWQMSTIQVDFQQPKRFGLTYTAADGSRQQPVMIHRALFGSVERFFGILLEHYAGAFPAWLAPVQVVGIPVADAHVPHLEEFATRLRGQGVRVEVDTSDERMQKKIRTAQRQKVPFMVIAGDDDVAKDAVSFRFRNGDQDNGIPLDEAVGRVVEEIASRRATP